MTPSMVAGSIRLLDLTTFVQRVTIHHSGAMDPHKSGIQSRYASSSHPHHRIPPLGRDREIIIAQIREETSLLSALEEELLNRREISASSSSTLHGPRKMPKTSSRAAVSTINDNLNDRQIQRSRHTSIHSQPNTTQRSLREIEEHIWSLQIGIAQKKNITSAFWLIPPEIWCMVFLDCTQIHYDIPSRSSSIDPGVGDLFSALKISGVCHLWRTTALGYSELWANIAIVWESWKTFNIQRVEHYLTYSKGCRQTLFINCSDETCTGDVTGLGRIFERRNSIHRIICFLSFDYNSLETSILDRIPGARELWMLRHPSHHNTPRIGIPLHHCYSAKHLVLFSVRVEWEDNKEVHLEAYSASIPEYFVRLPEESIPGSLQTLHTLQIDAGGFRTAPSPPSPTLLANIRTIKTNIRFLALSLLQWYKMPQLKRIEVTSPSILTDWEWCSAVSSMDITQIKELACASMTEKLASLAEYVREFEALTRLEIQGKSVDAMLSTFISNQDTNHIVAFPSLRLLTISNYTGTGECLIDFLRARREVRDSRRDLVISMPEICFKDCRMISMENQSVIRSLCIML